MSERKINLVQILNNIYDEKYRSNYKTDYSEQCILEAMKEAIKQTLELAAENAYIFSSKGESTKQVCTREYEDEFSSKMMDVDYRINKQSILDTINQIE